MYIYLCMYVWVGRNKHYALLRRVLKIHCPTMKYIYVSVNLCNQAIRGLTENFRQFIFLCM